MPHWKYTPTCGRPFPELEGWGRNRLFGGPFTATEKDVNRPWGGGDNGKWFRCAFCGHKFSAGDSYRCIYTNYVKGAPGNPFVCESCDGPGIIARWKEMHKLARTRFWWFTREK